MSKVLVIGTGGVGRVVAYKCAQAPEMFDEIHVANRTFVKAEKLKSDIKRDAGITVYAHELDADDTSAVADLMKDVRPDIAVHVALPYQNIPVMKACLEAKVHYMDTAISETLDSAVYDYRWQKAYHERFRDNGLVALLGCGFDPGATNVMCAYAQKNLFDRIKTIDILDCNAGDHGQHFMPNFNPEINIREVTQNARYWEKGKGWVGMPSILDDDALHFSFDYPVVGNHESYILFHEEEMSLIENIKDLERIRFWMTFTPDYIKHLSVLKNTGLTSIVPVNHQGQEIVPVQFLQSVLPKSGNVADTYTGKTAIGCVFNGIKDNEEISRYIYQICDHQDSFKETGIHAIAYTTGVPAMVGAMLIADGTWNRPGVYHPEQFNPDPFMKEIGERGLPWQVVDGKKYLESLPK